MGIVPRRIWRGKASVILNYLDDLVGQGMLGTDQMQKSVNILKDGNWTTDALNKLYFYFDDLAELGEANSYLSHELLDFLKTISA